MPGNTLFDSLHVSDNQELTKFFSSFDSYDQPYFILIQHNESTDLVHELCSHWTKSNEEEICWASWDALADNIMFMCMECESSEKDKFTKECLKRLNSVTHIGVFAHNCLGEPLETFRWATILLEDTIQTSPEASSIGTNDFTDRENWPGLKRYTD